MSQGVLVEARPTEAADRGRSRCWGALRTMAGRSGIPQEGMSAVGPAYGATSGHVGSLVRQVWMGSLVHGSWQGQVMERKGWTGQAEKGVSKRSRVPLTCRPQPLP